MIRLLNVSMETAGRQMAGRPTDWHLVGRDTDPTPGDPDTLRTWESYFTRRSDDAHDKMFRLRNIQSHVDTLQLEGTWITAIWGRCDYLAQQLMPEWSCHQQAAEAFGTFRHAIPEFQQNADYGLAMARKACADRDRAQGRLSALAGQAADLDASAGVCTPDSPEAGHHRRAAEDKLDEANAALRNAKNLVDTAADNFHAAATALITALNTSEQVLGNGIFNPNLPITDVSRPKPPSLGHRAVGILIGDLYGLAAISANTLSGADDIGENVDSMMMFGDPGAGGPGDAFALTDGTTSDLADSYAFSTDPFKNYESGDGAPDDATLQRNYEDRWPRNGPTPPQARAADIAGEETYGGHTLDRHVGKSDDFLRERLRMEDIDAASTYTSYTEATTYVNKVAVDNKVAIDTWLKGTGKNNLVVTSRFDGASIGRRITRTEMEKFVKPQSSDEATVVLKKDPNAPEGYYVLTSFPGPPK